jgi:hypothetical protein
MLASSGGSGEHDTPAVSSKLASGGTSTFALERTLGSSGVHVWRVIPEHRQAGRWPTMEEALEAAQPRRARHKG